MNFYITGPYSIANLYACILEVGTGIGIMLTQSGNMDFFARIGKHAFAVK
jgi:hypothetical protein